MNSLVLLRQLPESSSLPEFCPKTYQQPQLIIRPSFITVEQTAQEFIRPKSEDRHQFVYEGTVYNVFNSSDMIVDLQHVSCLHENYHS